MTVSASAADPVKLWLDKVSDHSPLQVSLVPCAMVEPGAGDKPQRISPQLAKSEKFKFAVEKLLEASQLGSLPAYSRLAMHKECLFEASRIARAEYFKAEPDSPLQMLLLCSTIIRCTVTNNMTLARNLLRWNPCAHCLVVVENGNVVIPSPEKLAKTLAEAKLQVLQIERIEIEKISDLKKRKSQLAAVKKMTET